MGLAHRAAKAWGVAETGVDGGGAPAGWAVCRGVFGAGAAAWLSQLCHEGIARRGLFFFANRQLPIAKVCGFEVLNRPM